MFYVYELVDPDTNKPFYIGKGKGPRIGFHVKRVQNGFTLINLHLHHTIAKILAAGKQVIERKIHETLDEDEAFSLEEHLIETIGMDNLCNLESGGKRGRTQSEETKRKKSAKLKGKPTKPRSEETKQKISRSLMGRISGPPSTDTRKKISEALTGKPKSEQHKQNMRKARKSK